MSKRNAPNIRVDPEFEKHMKEIAKIRFEKGLAKLKPNELSTREMTKLLTKTGGYRISLQELQTKPKRR